MSGALDFVLANVRVDGRDGAVDLGFRDGRIAAIEPDLPRDGRTEDAGGAYAFAGFTECHIHLDKAEILDRCPIRSGTLEEAISGTRAAKAAFTVEDVYERGARVVEKAILGGTMRLRSFVEIDEQAELRSFEALSRLKRDYADRIEIQICAFAQDGTTQSPRTLEMLDAALAQGADLVGGCPYTDPDPARQVAAIFDLAEKHGVDVDFHMDFSLDPARSDLPAVLSEAERRRWDRPIALGHMTNLSAMPRDAVARLADRMAERGLSVVTLPATDLFLMGRDSPVLTPRGLAPLPLLAEHGVVTAIGTNNVLNPFTPFGDAALMRMANLYANAAQLRSDAEIAFAFGLVSDAAARLMGEEPEIAIGAPATVVTLDAPDRIAALRTAALPLAGWRNGVKTFERPRGRLL